MPQSPQILAEPLLLTPFSERHLQQHYVDWLNDKALMRYSENRHRVHTLASCRDYVSGFVSSPHYLWAIEAIDQGNAHVGNITASVDEYNRLADIGILIGAPSAHGKGYGYVAWKAVMDFLAKEEIAEKITGGCLEGNEAMVRIMEKAGMKPDGSRPDHYLVDAARMSVVYYAYWPQTAVK